MKTDRSYVLKLLSVQMIGIPVFLTFGLYIVYSLLSFFSVDLGRDSWRLIHLGIAGAGSLLVGLIAGCIFSRSKKTKPESAALRYLTPLLPILYALIFAILAVVLSKGNYNSQWWGIYMLKNPVFIVFDFFIAFSGLTFLMPVAELMGYTGVALGIYLDEYRSKTLLKDKAAGQLKLVFALVCAAVVVCSGMSTRDVIQYGMIELVNGRTTLGQELTEFDLARIAPFRENNSLVKLGKPAALQFTELESMPRLDGATAAYPLYGAFVEAVYKGLGEYYQKNINNDEKDAYTAFVENENYPYNIVKCSKTTAAYQRLIDGQTDIIFVAEPSEKQLEAVRAKGDAFVLTPIGSEAFVFFTNVKNPVENLTVKQIQGIYSGEITNWKEVGGSYRSILAFQRPEDSGSQTIMVNRVMKNTKMMEPTKDIRASGMGEIISQVAGYKNASNAIGYSFMYYASQMIQNNQVKYLSIDGVEPSPETIRSNAYPFTVPVYAVTLKSNKNEKVGKLLEWVISEEGQSLVERTGYVSIAK